MVKTKIVPAINNSPWLENGTHPLRAPRRFPASATKQNSQC